MKFQCSHRTENPAQPSSSSKLDGQDSTLETNRSRILTAPLPNPISKNIETIASLKNREDQTIPTHQQWLEGIARFFGKPVFLYCLMSGLAIWILGSLLNQAEILPFELPSFSWSGQGLDAAALLISTGVLVRQSRQENFAEQRSQLMLQLNLLSEQKIAKIIELLEELRADHPDIDARYDPEVQVMQEPADPVEVLDALQENLEQELLTDIVVSDNSEELTKTD